MQNPSVIRRNSRIATTTHARTLSWSFILLLVVCACVVATGFFFAARQHFISMEYGIKNSKLRDQLRSLEAEKRRLMLAREVASSPLAIRKAAMGLGLRHSSDVAAIPVSTKVPPAKDAAPVAAAVLRSDTKGDAPAIVRTVLNVAARNEATANSRPRVVEAKKDKKDKTEIAALLKLK